MKNQNHLYLSKLKKTKYSLEKSLNDLEQYDLDEESIRMIKILKDRIKENQKQIIALEKEINNIPGVVTNGIFALRPANAIIIGNDESTEVITNT